MSRTYQTLKISAHLNAHSVDIDTVLIFGIRCLCFSEL